MLVVGGESTGKSTLVQNLALAYNTNFVAEVGRETCEYAGGEELMIREDLIENLIRQKDEVRRALKSSNRILFVDTDALTTGFYCNLLLENVEEKHQLVQLADSIHWTNEWDLVLFLEPEGVDFVQDGTRNEEIKAERRKYSELLKEMFTRNNVKLACIAGDYLERFNRAKDIIERELKISTRF